MNIPRYRANGFCYFTDPHNIIDGRPKGRIDNTEDSLQAKQEWIVDYANRHDLILLCGGDMFHQRNEQSNRLVGRLLRTFGKSRYPVMMIPGNHDMRDYEISENDAISTLGETWNFILARKDSPLCELQLPSGKILGIGGSPWNREMSVPDTVEGMFPAADTVVWMTHFSAGVPSKDGDGELRIIADNAREIKGCRFVLNGDIHKSFGEMLQEAEMERGLPVKDHSSLENDILKCGQSMWINPGSVGRTSSDQHIHVPSVITLEEGTEEEGYRPALKKVAIEAAKPAHEVFSIRENETVKVEINSDQKENGTGTHEHDRSQLAQAASELKTEIENEAGVDYEAEMHRIAAEMSLDEKNVKVLERLLAGAESKNGIVT